MNFKGKPVSVVLVGNAKLEYKELKRIVSEERSEGKLGTNYQIIFNSLKQKIDILKINPQYGVHISKNKILLSYKKQYGINNLWKVNLAGAWRLLYTIRGSDVEILTIVLGIVSHKEYDKKLGYGKR